MRKSIATVSLSGTLEEKLAAAARAGFDAVEIFEADLISAASPARDIRAMCADLGLGIDIYQPLRDFEGAAPKTFRANLRRAAGKFELMRELGTDLLLVCSSVAPRAAGDDGLIAEQLHTLAELAAGHGCRVAYEALAWGRHVNDYRHAWKLVAAAGHPSLGVCLDSFHILSRGHDPAGIREIPGDKIFFLQLADAPRMLMDVLQWSRHHRCFPGQGSFGLAGFLRHTLAAGYAGPLSLEVFNDVFRQADAERTATDALRSLIALEEAVLPESPVAPPAPLRGFSFAEIAVDPLGGVAAERMLRALGFTRAARHRTKPVHLWQQGDARILVNAARPAPADRRRGDAAVSAVAVDSADPAQSAARAEALLAPGVPRSFGPGEAELTAITAPDGTLVFFCGTEWLGDFSELDTPPPGAAGITTIDHIALSQPAHHAQEAALFYQSVLGMRRHDPVEIADPYGLVRSFAMTSPGGAVRLALSVPALAGDPLPQSAGHQHVAFACTDIFATARAVHAGGASILPIPANYYADLATRTDLGTDFLAGLREANILHDRTEDGEFLHFFTTMLGRRLFFEVVQRINGYDGYGAANTPVRMAAQYRLA
ncbi:sugar phosphate isomerase/epimerase and 4-hydroxyphenylpyruvate domain-containing protein [Winogradskya consettensis]|uniref:3-dehydroshikimate dehydratase n=1 Tax=Winogradskya consettensis TaxID=113560 RepID=A0A919SG78_9ACTN|nr:sugar phosphate isomerase/epimerase and 4-hydroxyphenylpyruvate domain-containing protein [Actinoplanes consettensis]GIM71099.1 4-hydroxyphenylpyruvate dioxygenase [Actinoplanes consettensis]